MQQLVALPKRALPVMLRFGYTRKVSDEAFLEFCRTNPDIRCERTADGEVVIVPPAGVESSHRSVEVATDLTVWARRVRRGKAFDSSVMFMLPDGSSLSPDASWVSNESLRRLSREQRKEFLRLCPEFVVEVMSPSDRLRAAKEKMEQWIANGCQLGWLIDADRETVYVYRPDQGVATLRGIPELAGDGPVKGFVLPLRSIWAGLR